MTRIHPYPPPDLSDLRCPTCGKLIGRIGGDAEQREKHSADLLLWCRRCHEQMVPSVEGARLVPEN